MSIKLFTLGCKVNQAEAEVYREFDTSEDIWIINTCCITSKAESESLSLIRKLANEKSEKTRLIVTGCLASIRDFSLSDIGNLEIAPNRDKDCLFEILTNTSHIITPLPEELPQKRTRSFIKIQDGCNRRCSYCIVWKARGKSRSHRMSDIIDCIKNLSQKGLKEVVLTGVCIGSYGRDSGEKESLELLLNLILNETDIQRIRLSSLDVGDISDEMIDLLRNNKRICPHLHIPIQSASRKIRRLMNRKGWDIDIKRFMDELIENIPDLNIGFDIIAGFPTEKEEDFLETLDLLEKVDFGYLHVFQYSRRIGTKAAEMENQVPDSVKKERSSIIRNIGMRKKEKFLNRYIGKKLSILFQSESRNIKGFTTGLSDNYIKTLTPNSIKSGKILELKIINKKNGYMLTDLSGG
ncbi:MAG: MiaB/RimO family radical SAM methylthiotransferase [Candidatus Coatesbacteria bacterium]|nr:MiaB/RimO family radical SAM methylthiotransferase [Candidatus Coatesbacteria bacterium]